MNNYIYFKHKSKIIIKKGSSNLSKKYVATLLVNLEALGYTLSKELIDIISTYSVEEIDKFYKNTIQEIKKMLGAHVVYNPMYPNFPQQVMDMSQENLYINALYHYHGDAIGYRLLPEYANIDRKPFYGHKKLKIIELGNKEEFNKIFTDLLSSKVSISQTNKEDIDWFVKNKRNNIISLIPEYIPLRETVAVISSSLIQNTDIYDLIIPKYIKRANDILRLAAGMSNGDVSLATNTKFRNFSKKERKYLLSLLETSEYLIKDLLKYREKWLRIGEKLHPGDYKNKFPKVLEAFDIIRNEKKVETINSRIENLLVKKDIDQVMTILESEPSLFARRLDHLIRISNSPEEVISRFKKVSYKVSTPILLQLMNTFTNRNTEKKYRTFFPKGVVSKVFALKNKLTNINEDLCREVTLICTETLKKRFSKLPSLGNVFIDEDLKDYTIPFTMRSASKSLRSLSRGSKVKFQKSNVVRFFLWWKQGSSEADIDLSAVGLGKDFTFRTEIAYYNLKDIGGYHSGDITTAPDGASEFIDIDIEKFKERDIHYVVMCVNSYSQQPFCDLPECFAGIMSREEAGNGEIYEPSTVENKIDISSDTKISIVAIIDITNMKMVWADIALEKKIGLNNVDVNLSPIKLMAKAIVDDKKPDLYTLFKLHAEARGKIVTNKEEADSIFAVEEGITPYNTLQITSEYL